MRQCVCSPAPSPVPRTEAGCTTLVALRPWGAETCEAIHAQEAHRFLLTLAVAVGRPQTSAMVHRPIFAARREISAEAQVPMTFAVAHPWISAVHPWVIIAEARHPMIREARRTCTVDLQGEWAQGQSTLAVLTPEDLGPTCLVLVALGQVGRAEVHATMVAADPPSNRACRRM